MKRCVNIYQSNSTKRNTVTITNLKTNKNSRQALRVKKVSLFWKKFALPCRGNNHKS